MEENPEMGEINLHDICQEKILPSIKLSLTSVRQSINKRQRKHCFELFGYDYILDINLQPWLIEVNTNPDLEESSAMLSMLLPRLLDDAFKLTVDVMFPPLPNTGEPSQVADQAELEDKNSENE